MSDHAPHVDTVRIVGGAIFYPGCGCGWYGTESWDIVHAARAAKDHARMSNDRDSMTTRTSGDDR